MSKFKTLVLLFALLNLLSFSVSLANGMYAGDACDIFYQQTLRRSQKPMVLTPWNSPNKIFDNKETRNIDQCSSRECFLFAYLGALETTHANRHLNPRTIRFSAGYLVAKKLEHVIGELLSNNQNGRGMYFNLKGGETYHAMKLTQLYGLVPEEIWRPLEPDLNNWDFPKIYSDIIEKVNAIIQKRSEDPNAYPDSDIPKLTQEIFQDVLGHYVGQWPKPFWYDGIHHTPESFGRLYNFDMNGVVEVSTLNPNGPYQDQAQTHNLRPFLNRLYNNGAGYNGYIKPDTSESLFKSVENALGADRAVLLDINGTNPAEPGIGHQLVISDVEVKPDNTVKAVRLKNSYTNWGLNGYTWYSADIVAKNLRRIWIFDVNKNIPQPKLNPPPQN